MKILVYDRKQKTVAGLYGGGQSARDINSVDMSE
jgi:hypothetical protein